MIRLALTALSALYVFSARAQSALDAAKPDAIQPMETAGAGMGVMPLLQMMLAMGIVLGLVKVLLPKIATKLNKRLSTPVGSAIRIEESAAFAGGNLYLVKVREKELLLGVGTNGVTCLADVTGPVKPEPPAFLEVLEQEEAKAVVPNNAVVEALRRLDSLAR